MNTNDKKVFCAMPWVHFHVGDKGMVNACCVANIPLGNINKQSVEEIWNGEKIQKLRDQFVTGKSDHRCSYCLNIESAGGQSIRQETLVKFEKDIRLQNPAPIYFDIRFSNQCNYKCRTCWHGASSMWFEDAQQLGNTASHQQVILNVSDFDQFISQMGPYLKNAKEIYLAGGEPTVTPMHYKLLDWLLENNVTNVHLRYNTNLSVLKHGKYQLPEIWSQFKKVTVMVSVDETHELGSYIRSGMKWEKVVKHIQILQNIPHITVQVAPTVSVLNIRSFVPFLTYLFTEKLFTPNQVYINILERPLQYNMQILPKKEKLGLTNKLEAFVSKYEAYPEFQRQIQHIVHYLNRKDQSSQYHRFDSYNSRLDALRMEEMPSPKVI